MTAKRVRRPSKSKASASAASSSSASASSSASSPSKSRSRSRATSTPPPETPFRDENAEAAGLLMDMVALQPEQDARRRMAYRRAANAVLALPEPVSRYAADDRLSEIAYIGPSTERILREFVDTGTSETVAQAIAKSGRDLQRQQELRKNYISQALAEAVLAVDADPSIVSLDDYRGDFQMHSTYSDGKQTLAEIVETSLQLGMECAAVTDHSYGLPVAHGMSMEAAARQHAEIDALNRRHKGRFRLFKGVEANIRGDGTIDMEPDELRLFEIIVLSPHSGLRSSMDQTARMVKAVSQPFVDILGHPRGRRYDMRTGVQVRWREVFAAAAAHGVAIEIDGFVERQDIDWLLAADALRAGCLFALDSDGHDPGELLFYRMAIAHARLAGIPSDRIVNCWSNERLMEWTASHR